MTNTCGLRERKKQRTRRALIEAAIELFERQGYDATTVAQIAAAADVSTRTFFSYFPAKEDILFADTHDRLAAAAEAITGRAPGERPADVLLRIVQRVLEPGSADVELFGRLAPVRVRLLTTTPALQGHALRRLFEGQRRLAGDLHRAFPADLDPVTAAAVVGSFMGALMAAAAVAVTAAGGLDALAPGRQEEVAAQLRRAVVVPLDGIRALETG